MTPWPARWSRRRRAKGDLAAALMAPLSGLMRLRLWGAASSILVATPDAKTLVPRRFRDRVSWLPFGVDTGSFVGRPDPNGPSVLMLGRLEPMKRHREFLAAWRLVVRQVPDARLLIVGDGSQKAPLQEDVIKMGLAGSVTLAPELEHADTAALIRTSRLLVSMSDGEPFGMAVLEAMACSRPVVSAPTGGPTTLLVEGKNASFADPDDEESLARSLLDLLLDRERVVRFGRSARDRAEKSFNTVAVIDELEQIYIRVVDAAGAPWS